MNPVDGKGGANDLALRLVINAESLAPPRTGIGTYTASLLAEYTELLPVENIQVFFQGRLQPADRVLAGSAAVTGAASRRRERLLGMLYRLASVSRWPYNFHQARNRRAFVRVTRQPPVETVYHEPNFVLKPYGGPSVVTVHDLSFIHYPKYHPAARVAWLNRHLPGSLRDADHVITVSEFVRREVIEEFGVDEDRITAIHPGVSSHFHVPETSAISDVLARYGLEADRYVLCVSTLEPRKNIETLMRAWEGLPLSIRQNHKLVVVGSRGWHCKNIERKLRSLCARGEAAWLGYVPEYDLSSLYAGASVFVFPSSYEGFGLPVLEAMACGAAVITSRETAMAEFARKYVELVDPFDVEALRQGLLRLFGNEKLRQRLGKSAVQRASQFSWRRCAERHLDVYRRAREARVG